MVASAAPNDSGREPSNALCVTKIARTEALATHAAYYNSQ